MSIKDGIIGAMLVGGGSGGKPVTENTVWYPDVDENTGDISWSRSESTTPPQTTNIKGPPGEGVPGTTEADDGKVLGVENGQTAWVDPPSGLPDGGTDGQVLTQTDGGPAWSDVPKELPEGGAQGQVLTQGTDGPTWADAPDGLPDGGTAGQVLTKTEGGSEWSDAPSGLPEGGAPGQVLTVGESGQAQWDDPDGTLPTGGTEGQVLTKTASGSQWEDLPTELPQGGTAGQILTKTETGTEWADAQDGIPTGGTSGQVLTQTEEGPAWQNVPSQLPEGGQTSQVLTKTPDGEAWSDIPSQFPEGGTPGQILTKTQEGQEWQDAPSGLPDGGTEGQTLSYGANGPEWKELTAEDVGANYSAGNGVSISPDRQVSVKLSTGQGNAASFDGEGGLFVSSGGTGELTATPVPFILSADGWTGNEAPYSQTVAVPGLTVIDSAITGPEPGSRDAAANAGVKYQSQSDGGLTYTCRTIPSVDLAYQALIFQGEAQIPVYGAEWSGGTSPVWTRTDDAADFEAPSPAVNNGTGSSPFDDIYPWSGMVKEDDPTAGTLVRIPKYYYKWTRTGSAMKLQISPEPQDGFLTSPAHADRGDGQGERDFVYVARYHCGSDYKSTTGVLPINTITRATARASIHNLGQDIWQYDFAAYWTIMMLYLVEFGTWKIRDAIGRGHSPAGVLFNVGATDAMQYHTGTTAASRDEYGCCQYRNIEGLWDNVYDWCDGVYFNNVNVYCIHNPANFSDSTGGTLVGQRPAETGMAYISAWNNPAASGYEWALYPSQADGTEDTYVCDAVFYAHSGAQAPGQVFNTGASNDTTSLQAAFSFGGSSPATHSHELIGCRLMKLPNNG